MVERLCGLRLKFLFELRNLKALSLVFVRPFAQPCTLSDMPHVWDEEHWYVTFTGPVYAGKYFSEWFLLNYLNGMEYAWGKLT